MEKKNECEIVQDLLIGYVDETLNVESKKLVENHLKECKKCKERLNEVKEDMNLSEDMQKKEIDYLKKVRCREKIKAILIAIGIILAIAVIIITTKFVKINSVMKRGNVLHNSQNCYIESQQILSNGAVAVSKTYYRDGKYKKTRETYLSDGTKNIINTYGEVGSDKLIEADETNKKVFVRTGDMCKRLNEESTIKWDRLEERNMFSANFGKVFLCSLDSEYYEMGKKCYILKYKSDKRQRHEIHLDKETGLVIKEINREAEKTFIPGTDIVNQINDRIETFKYKFNEVSDEDVKVPDYSEFNFEYIEYNT